VVTTSYVYDVNDERIALSANSATTTYPFTFYNVATSSTGKATFTKHIFIFPTATPDGSRQMSRQGSTLLAVSQTSSPNILLESREPHTLLALAEAGQGERLFRRSLRTDG
jgi:hypothetical protein